MAKKERNVAVIDESPKVDEDNLEWVGELWRIPNGCRISRRGWEIRAGCEPIVMRGTCIGEWLAANTGRFGRRTFWFAGGVAEWGCRGEGMGGFRKTMTPIWQAARRMESAAPCTKSEKCLLQMVGPYGEDIYHKVLYGIRCIYYGWSAAWSGVVENGFMAIDLSRGDMGGSVTSTRASQWVMSTIHAQMHFQEHM